MTVLREELHQLIDQLPEAELGLVFDYVRTHAHPATGQSPTWEGPSFIGAFASGRADVSEHGDDLLFGEHTVRRWNCSPVSHTARLLSCPLSGSE